MSLIRSHYSKLNVRREIVEYCKGRWIAVHCELRNGRGLPLMIRYERGSGAPLKITSDADLSRIFKDFRRVKPRSIYATINTYRRLEIPEDVIERKNIVSSMPTWDIDSRDGDWRKVVKKAVEIIGALDRFGVAKSVFFKWSGRGAHVHINQNAFSREVQERIHPLDIAYSVTQYIINKLSPSEGVVVENKIDLQRVFTVPLSFHRELDRVAVCVNPQKLEDFDISWTDPNHFRHDPDSWRRYEIGEGDELARRAFLAIGPYIPRGIRRRRKHKPLDKQILETLERYRGELDFSF